MSAAEVMEKTDSNDSGMSLRAACSGSGLPVLVIFTSICRTRKALEKAGQLARLHKGGIEILAMQTIPFTLPLEGPSVALKSLLRQLQKMAALFPEPIRISTYLCRDEAGALKRVLNRRCPVVMGVRKGWWPTRDTRLARNLRRAGYNIILVPTE